MSLHSKGEGASGRETRISLRAYLRGRKYHHGRGRSDTWSFLAEAVGDPAFPNARSWKELRDYLEGNARDSGTVEAAKVLWRSYLRNAPKALGR